MNAPGGSHPPDLEDLARRAVELALAAGADDAEAWVELTDDREVRVYGGAVESLTAAGSRGAGLRVFRGERSGYAYGTDLGPVGLQQLAGAAAEAAAVADPDPYGGLPDETGAAGVDALYAPGVEAWDEARKIDLALAVERAARATHGVTQVEDAVYADGVARVALANSRGFAAAYEASSAWAYATAFAGEGADLMTGAGVGLAREPQSLDAEAIGREAGERAAALAGARQPPSRRCPVVLDAFVAASFVGFVGQMLSADAVQRGRSLFAGREGEQVAAAAFVLADDGLDAGGIASAPFDAEGTPRRRTPLVEEGRLRSYLFDARTARRAGDGRRSTGNAHRASYRSPPAVGASNLVLEPGADSVEALTRRAGDGLLVTDVAGLHSGVNPVSGTFSVGATGRLIERGELGRPVRELTIASDLVSMLRAVESVGAPARWVPFGGSVKAAPVLIGEMTVSGA